MFLGEYQHTLDPKGRVILPSAFRDELAEGLVMTVGLDHCIEVRSSEGWKERVEQLRSLRSTDARERRFVRMMTALAAEQHLDKQGRVSVPTRLREYASMDKELAVVGSDDHIELWDAGRWSDYRDQALADFANTDEAFGLGSL